MNEEFRIASRIRQILDHGVDNLAPAMATRLHEARQRALARQQVSVGGLSLAGAGHGSRHFGLEGLSVHARTLLVALVLLASGVTSAYHWSQFQRAAEHAEIDSALLADEIPFNVYLDQDFLKWLDNLAQEQETS
ncbi:MAG: DUF3619 family protein [Rhodocyclaceae bacterium]|nr:DUF3619 family protein [Rhodocyclaceae bacterium]